MHLNFITSELLEGTPHGFFTREGGASKGLYASLNCGPGSHDDARDVRENRRRCAAALGFGADRLITLYQVHSPNVVTVTKPWSAAPPEADAMVTKTPGLMLGILTADCAPVLFADPKAKVVAAAHAGWKGAFGGVLKHTIEVMIDHGATRENISAVIGPCISQKSYEIGPEFYAKFAEQAEEQALFFIPSRRPGHYLFNLPGYAAHRLADAGLRRIAQIDMDTCSEETRFFSYRRKTLKGEADYGRQLSAIGLKA